MRAMTRSSERILHFLIGLRWLFNQACLACEGSGIAGINVENVASTFGRFFADEKIHRFRNVFRQYAAFEQAALAVEFFNIVRIDLVGSGALLLPFAIPNAGAANDSIRIDDIDADGMWCTFERNAARQVDFCSLGGAIGGSAGRGDQAILARHEHDAATQTLRRHAAKGTATDQ